MIQLLSQDFQSSQRRKARRTEKNMQLSQALSQVLWRPRVLSWDGPRGRPLESGWNQDFPQGGFVMPLSETYCHCLQHSLGGGGGAEHDTVFLVTPASE